MMKMSLSLMVIFLSIFMFYIEHPISLGLLILLQTLLICLIMGFLIKTYWFSYILFLIFLGGLLILFIYMASIASNEIFNFSIISKFNLIMMFFMIILITTISTNNLNWLNFSFNEDMDNFLNLLLFYLNENNINLYKLYNDQTYLLMTLLIIYLFISLIAVTKITNIFFGPIRSFY